MSSAKIEQEQLGSCRGVEVLKEEVEVLETQLAELEQKNLQSPVLLRKLGRYFGFGAAGKLDWARFKLNYKQEELDRFETEARMLRVAADHYDAAADLRSAPQADRAGETTRHKTA